MTTSVRTIARQEGIDLAGLVTILEQRRPEKSTAEQDFVDNTIAVIPGIQKDDFGNYYLTIGNDPKVLWSCHTDTVSAVGGRQNVKWTGDILSLNEGKAGQSLGADDGAGLWLLLEMIKAERPGLYIFHRAEECGGLGSKHIKLETPELLDGIDMAIAFDRRGTDSVITFQRSKRCCSDKFAEALGAALGSNFKKDTGGSFTDTANYTELVAECTNVSVGYDHEHGPRETLDVAHLLKLRTALLALDTTTLPIERDKTKVEWDDYGGYGGSWGGYGNWTGKESTWAKEKREIAEIEEILTSWPHTVARWLHESRHTADTLELMLGKHVRTKPKQAVVMGGPKLPVPVKSAEQSAQVFGFPQGEPKDTDAAAREYVSRLTNPSASDEQEDAEDSDPFEENGLYCGDCDEAFEAHFDDVENGEYCDKCSGRNTQACTVYIDPISGDIVEHAIFASNMQ